jgi:hypothetical protein
MGGGGNPLEDLGDAVGDVFESVGNAVQDTGEFVGNVVQGTVNSVVNVAEGAISGDWNKFRDGVIGVVSTAVAVTAIVVGVASGNYLAVAAGTTMLDAQYNKGKILGNVIHTVGDAEHDVFGTNNINNAAYEIQAVITVAASFYGTSVAMGPLMELTGLGAMAAAVPEALKTAIAYAYTGYQLYDAYYQIQATKEYWEAQLAEYQRQMQLWLAKAEAAKDQWFDLMMDYDMRQRVMPGGDLYNGGAGSYYYSPTQPHEPCKYLLSMTGEADAEMDNAITGRGSHNLAGGQNYLNNLEGGIRWPK